MSQAVLVDITVNAAHNIDKAHDWPNADYRERLMFLVRVVWVATLSGMAASGLTLIFSLLGEVFYLLFFPAFGLLFPILFAGWIGRRIRCFGRYQNQFLRA